MNQTEICPLCQSESRFFIEKKSLNYFQCPECSAIFISRKDLPSEEDEINRYETHNNDVNDPRYQNFVRDIVDGVVQDFDKNTLGLDYGAGTGPVISKMLEDKDYSINQYDPFFHPDKSILDFKYDYIVCCEVVEHFFNPLFEFKSLKKLLKSNGKLYCKTELYNSEIDFEEWYYNEDPTHVFFYTEDTANWIKENIGFSNLEIKGRMIIFSL
jgi:SAM-dependent methyltransferase